jgi:hypothetical protein
MGEAPKSIQMTAALHAYLVSHGTPPDEIQRALIDETRALGNISVMQIAPEQGAFMTLFARILGARHAIEIGTFTGYSALCLARGLPDDGKLISICASLRQPRRSRSSPGSRSSTSRSSTPTNRLTSPISKPCCR